jgi:hypothetical protein
MFYVTVNNKGYKGISENSKDENNRNGCTNDICASPFLFSGWYFLVMMF